VAPRMRVRLPDIAGDVASRCDCLDGFSIRRDEGEVDAVHKETRVFAVRLSTKGCNSVCIPYRE
jgi:hypothetical protein